MNPSILAWPIPFPSDQHKRTELEICFSGSPNATFNAPNFVPISDLQRVMQFVDRRVESGSPENMVSNYLSVNRWTLSFWRSSQRESKALVAGSVRFITVYLVLNTFNSYRGNARNRRPWTRDVVTRLSLD